MTEDEKSAWEEFAALFIKERGFAPHERDRLHRELFHWYLLGTSAEPNRKRVVV
jgi:hypothetical protein